MIFFSNLILSTIYCVGIGKIYGNKQLSAYSYFALFTPIIILWLIICSTQYFVGTDYGSYIEIFNGNDIDRYEIGFLTILHIFFSMGLKGQIFYLIFYIISFVFLFSLFKEFDTNVKYIVFFIIIYICVSNLFNNQLNGLRQAVATYIGSLGFVFYTKGDKIKYWIYCFIAFSIHYASAIYIIALLSSILSRINSKGLLITIAVGFILSLSLNSNMLYHITDYLPSIYSKYILYNFIENRSLSSMALKYIIIPFYILAIYNKSSYNLSKSQNLLFTWGIIGFAIKLGLMGIPFVSRISDYFILISIYPLYCLFKHLALQHKNTECLLLNLSLIFIYFIKTVIFPSAEYSYQSIISQIF